MSYAAFQPGTLIGGRYRLIRIIGAGAMGAVWSARNESTDRDFALKLMLPDAAKNPVALQRFFQEAKASGRLRHRCVVEVYDLGRIESLAGRPPDPHAGTPYLVMELLEGEPLDSVLRRVNKLPAGTAFRVVADVARGLDVAHKQRIVHRDLKPGNLFLHKTLEATIVPKILDFGISKLVGPTNMVDPVATSAGTVLGSPAYMSPEQAAGELDVDGRSDVWSLGVILYKCLCGTVPFQAANYNALMIAITSAAPQPISARLEGLPPAAVAIVHKCLSKKREERYESAKALADDIDKLLKEHTYLPTVELADIVTTPVELSADEARTIAQTHAERSQAGTLAATEAAIEDLAPTRAIESVSGSQATRATTGENKVIVSVPPPFRSPLATRLRVAIGVGGVVALLAIVIAVSRRGEDTPAPGPNVAAQAPAPLPTGATTTTAASSKVAEPPAPTTTSSATAPPPPPTSASTSVVVAATTHKPAPPSKPAGKPKPAPSGKPAHEGVTGAGF